MGFGVRDSIVPEPEAGREKGRDTRLVYRCEEPGLVVSIDERIDISTEAVNPRTVDETGITIWQAKMQEPRMVLEDGAIFKGGIDMDPQDRKKPEVSKPVDKKPADKKVEKAAVAPKVVSSDKAKENGGYSLHGG